MIPKHAEEILNEIDTLGYKLKGKDIGFIRSVKYLIKENKRLSPGQSKWLTDIYEKASCGGDYQSRQIY